MSNYGAINSAILKELEDGRLTGQKRNFVIYPFGEDGMLTKQILNQRYHIQELAIIDSSLPQWNPDIMTMDQFREKLDRDWAQRNISLLVTTKNVGVLRELEKIKSKVRIIHLLRVQKDYIGRYCYGPLAKGSLYVKQIGSFCSFAEGADVVPNHPLHMVTTHAFIYSFTQNPELNEPRYNVYDFNKKSTIGNDVWLGRNVIITNGANIGNGVIAAAGAIITKDVPDYAVVAGVPARIIRYRFTKEQIEELNEIAWWDWPVEKIKACYDDFMDIEVFIQKHSLRKHGNDAD